MIKPMHAGTWPPSSAALGVAGAGAVEEGMLTR